MTSFITFLEEKLEDWPTGGYLFYHLSLEELENPELSPLVTSAIEFLDSVAREYGYLDWWCLERDFGSDNANMAALIRKAIADKA